MNNFHRSKYYIDTYGKFYNSVASFVTAFPIPKVLYSCKEADTNQGQMRLVRYYCQGKRKCRIEVSRKFFGNRECPGTDDSRMKLWLVYSCDGGSDKTTSLSPNCGSGECRIKRDGNKKQLDIPGCGGWAHLVCHGGCLAIHKVVNFRNQVSFHSQGVV